VEFKLNVPAKIRKKNTPKNTKAVIIVFQLFLYPYPLFVIKDMVV